MSDRAFGLGWIVAVQGQVVARLDLELSATVHGAVLCTRQQRVNLQRVNMQLVNIMYLSRYLNR